MKEIEKVGLSKRHSGANADMINRTFERRRSPISISSS
jgi:hypothetical protein